MDDNKDKKIEFLKHEHSFMLQGLHEEIEKLQEQCSDMQLHLISNGIFPSDKVTEMLQEELDELKKKYETKMKDCQELQEELNSRKRIIEDLEHQIEIKDERYREDISARNLIIVRLRKEVQEKANTITSLVAFIQSKNKNTEKLKCNKKKQLEHQLSSPEVGCADDEVGFTRKLCRRLTSSLGGTASATDYSEAGTSNTSSNSSSTIGKQIIEKYFRSSAVLPSAPPNSTQPLPPPPIKFSAQLNCSMKNISI